MQDWCFSDVKAAPMSPHHFTDVTLRVLYTVNWLCSRHVAEASFGHCRISSTYSFHKLLLAYLRVIHINHWDFKLLELMSVKHNGTRIPLGKIGKGWKECEKATRRFKAIWSWMEDNWSCKMYFFNGSPQELFVILWMVSHFLSMLITFCLT